ncbi:MAG: DUF3473 domain-containing protein [Firmicutes bacterium]|nr:DUF3473 domain-containing protein [Bacillota bacterium]
MKNIFTIDTEDWFHANYEEGLFQNDKNVISTVEANTDVYLELFEKYNAKATFFILGFVAESHPGLVKKIFDSGHEVASHGYGHQLIYKQSQKEFREDIHKSKCILEDIIGAEVKGYRAPSWSITEKSLWALEILADEGFKYDSSIFPTKNFLYGIPNAPRFIKKHVFNDHKCIVEIPPSTLKVFMNVPFSGGFYFRAMPRWFIKAFAGIINNGGKENVFYLHPREIDPKQPRLNLKPRDALIHYYGINTCKSKLEYILKHFEFTSAEILLKEHGFL